MIPRAEKNQDPRFIAAKVAAVVVNLEAVERKKRARNRSEQPRRPFCAPFNAFELITRPPHHERLHKRRPRRPSAAGAYNLLAPPFPTYTNDYANGGPLIVCYRGDHKITNMKYVIFNSDFDYTALDYPLV
jgi:hypothetical protein